MGEVCGTIASMHPDERAFRESMDELNEFMTDRVLKPEVQRSA